MTDIIENDKKTDGITEISTCNDKERILSFLNTINSCFPVQISNYIQLDEYTEKILAFGKNFVIVENEEIVSAAFYYCNDYIGKKAYLSLLVTQPNFQNRGYAGILIKYAENCSKEENMSEMHLDTDATNINAIEFYKKQGYCIDGDYPRVHMYKRL